MIETAYCGCKEELYESEPTISIEFYSPEYFHGIDDLIKTGRYYWKECSTSIIQRNVSFECYYDIVTHRTIQDERMVKEVDGSLIIRMKRFYKTQSQYKVNLETPSNSLNENLSERQGLKNNTLLWKKEILLYSSFQKKHNDAKSKTS